MQQLIPLRVLLTDDSASTLKITSRFLEANRHSVVTAENGRQSLDCLQADFGQFDLLITDLQVGLIAPSRHDPTTRRDAAHAALHAAHAVLHSCHRTCDSALAL